jgi:hypothetical protein
MGRRDRRDDARALVVYESMYGNTHRIASAICDGLRAGGVVAVPLPVGNEDLPDPSGVDLLVVGGPTHVHGMSRPSTRSAARASVAEHEWLTLDDDADGTGLREWFGSLAALDVDAAAFDTRRQASSSLTGRASKGIARLLRRHGARVVDSISFFVTDHDELVPGEEPRAREWGTTLAATVRARSAAVG